MKKWSDFLEKLGACREGIEFADKFDSLRDAWLACERADFMLWYAARVGVDRRKIVPVACKCARRALQYVPKGEDRPRLTIEAAERWAENPTKKNKAAAWAARDAAWDAAEDAGVASYAAEAATFAAVVATALADASAEVASAAVVSAIYAAEAAAAAYAARASDSAEAVVRTRRAELRAMANIVREYISVGDLERGTKK